MHTWEFLGFEKTDLWLIFKGNEISVNTSEGDIMVNAGL